MTEFFFLNYLIPLIELIGIAFKKFLQILDERAFIRIIVFPYTVHQKPMTLINILYRISGRVHNYSCCLNFVPCICFILFHLWFCAKKWSLENKTKLHRVRMNVQARNNTLYCVQTTQIRTPTT